MVLEIFCTGIIIHSFHYFIFIMEDRVHKSGIFEQGDSPQGQFSKIIFTGAIQ
jgi:hypothetical protein